MVIYSTSASSEEVSSQPQAGSAFLEIASKQSGSGEQQRAVCLFYDVRLERVLRKRSKK